MEWLTTRPSGRAHTVECDEGRTGWRLHAVDVARGAKFEDIRNVRSVCGLKPAHGWDMDLFVETPCKKCERILATRPRPVDD